MLSGQEWQAVTTGASEYVTYLMSGCSYRWARLQCTYAGVLSSCGQSGVGLNDNS